MTIKPKIIILRKIVISRVSVSIKSHKYVMERHIHWKECMWETSSDVINNSCDDCWSAIKTGLAKLITHITRIWELQTGILDNDAGKCGWFKKGRGSRKNSESGRTCRCWTGKIDIFNWIKCVAESWKLSLRPDDESWNWTIRRRIRVHCIVW